MGRTFGLIIVSIGLWLVFSLPTHTPTLDERGVGSASGAVEPGARTLSSGSAAVPGPAVTAVDARLAGLRAPSVDQASPTRASRTLGERNLAARSREIESEPDAASQRPPGPVAIQPVVAPVSVTKLMDTNSLTPPAVAEQRMPAPGPVTGAAVRRPETQAAVGSQFVDHRTEVSPRPAAPVKAPRIFEIVRRDLAAASRGMQAAQTEPAKQTVSTPSNRASLASLPLPATARVTKSIPVTATRSVERENGTAQAFTMVPPPSKSPAKVAVLEHTQSDSKPRQTKTETKPKAVKNDNELRQTRPAPAPARHTPPAVAVHVSPPPQRVRFAQVYSPPAYVGRVVARPMPPPAYYVPSSGTARRSQFRGEAMWDTIRRAGM